VDCPQTGECAADISEVTARAGPERRTTKQAQVAVLVLWPGNGPGLQSRCPLGSQKRDVAGSPIGAGAAILTRRWLRMVPRHRRLEVVTLILWVLPLALVGFSVLCLLPVIALAQQRTGASSGGQLLLFVISAGFVGSAVGLAQRYALRHWAGVALLWARATALGWALAGAAWWVEYKVLGGDDFTVSAHDLPSVYFVTALAGGCAIGLGQWVAVRRGTHKSWLWVLMTAVAWISGIMISFAVVTLTSAAMQRLDAGYLTHNELFYFMAELGLLTIAGIIVGAVTGVGFLLLIRNYSGI